MECYGAGGGRVRGQLASHVAQWIALEVPQPVDISKSDRMWTFSLFQSESTALFAAALMAQRCS